MALKFWTPLVGNNIENQGLTSTWTVRSGTVTSGSDAGVLGKAIRIGASPSDSAARLRYSSSVDFSDLLGLDQTFMAWVKLEGTTVNYNGTIVSSGNWNQGNNSWSFTIAATGSHVFCGKAYSPTGIACTVPTGSWVHLAATRDGTTGITKIYRNGEFVKSGSGYRTGSLTSTEPKQLSIGIANYSNWCPFNGLIQDVRIYDEILSVRQIQEISKGLIAHYQLSGTDVDVTNKKVYDCSGNGYHGEVVAAGNCPVFDTDSPRHLRCAKFDTTSKYLRITTLPALGDIWTIAWWGKWSTGTGGYMFWGYQNGNRYNMYRTANKLYNNTGDGSNNPFYSSGTTVADAPFLDSWAHYAIVADGTNNKLYVNGELYATAKTFKGITGTALYMTGWDSSTSYKLANTCLSDFRIYGTALKAEQVKELYNNPISVTKNGNLMCMEVIE